MIALSMSTLSNFHCSSKTNIYKNKTKIKNSIMIKNYFIIETDIFLFQIMTISGNVFVLVLVGLVSPGITCSPDPKVEKALGKLVQ